MTNLMTRMRALVSNDEGQDLIEYALLAGLISLVAVATVTTAGKELIPFFDRVAARLTDANNQ